MKAAHEYDGGLEYDMFCTICGENFYHENHTTKIK